MADENKTTDWRESLPETLRADPALKDIKDVGALAKSFVDTKAFVGQSIRPPGPDAGAEAKKDFYAKLQKHAPDLVPLSDDPEAQAALWGKLGRPSKPEEYEYKAPEGVELPLDNLRQVALAAGMTRKQFEKFAEKAAEGITKQQGEAKADQAALKTEWGQAYEQKLQGAAAVAAKLNVPDPIVQQIKAGNLNSAQLKLWDSISKAMGAGEGSEVAKQGVTPQPGKLTPAEASTQIDEIMARPDKAYWDRNHPLHKNLVKKVGELMAAANP